MSPLPAPSTEVIRGLKARHSRERLHLFIGGGEHHIVVLVPAGGTPLPSASAHAELATFVCHHTVWPAKGVVRRAFQVLPGLVESFGYELMLLSQKSLTL